MRETQDELKELQALLDASLSRSTSHLRSITLVLTGMCTLALSTVTAKGEPAADWPDLLAYFKDFYGGDIAKLTAASRS